MTMPSKLEDMYRRLFKYLNDPYDLNGSLEQPDPLIVVPSFATGGTVLEVVPEASPSNARG